MGCESIRMIRCFGLIHTEIPLVQCSPVICFSKLWTRKKFDLCPTPFVVELFSSFELFCSIKPLAKAFISVDLPVLWGPRTPTTKKSGLSDKYSEKVSENCCSSINLIDLSVMKPCFWTGWDAAAVMLVAKELALSDNIFGLTLRLVELSFRPSNCFARVDGPGFWADDSDETFSGFLIETELASPACGR